ncbi:MAG TPA: alpha/beta hydrolase family protein [Mycobacteriales bacterium]|nr:alpha/beta hydrolase family protein [Mycobacteriales bacterium]
MRRIAATALVAACIAAGWSVPAASSAKAGPVLRSGHGLKVLAATQIDAREINARFQTAATGDPVNARILLPVGYAANPRRRYPTLYLYAGTGEHASDWTNHGDIEGLTEKLPLIVVMPDVGLGIGDGWFSNWRDTRTSLGPNQWETFQINQLIPWVDDNFRTVADRSGRAVAGLSQGGFGATIAATRHPDLFISVGSFSGAVDIAYGKLLKPVFQSFPIGTTLADFVPPFAVFGDPIQHQVNWKGHCPTTLVRNLRGMDVHLYTGNGLPGPYDDPTTVALASIEVLAHAETHTMYDHAVDLHIPIKLTDYGAGTHTFPYWIRDMRTYLPEIMRQFARHATRPAHVQYDATASGWKQWGWSVAVRRPVAEQFTYLRHAGANGFVLRGHGLARVTTPSFYREDSSITALVGSDGHAKQLTLRPDGSGRIALTVALPAKVKLSAHRAVAPSAVRAPG